jgi:hypothetical protein
MAGGNEAQRSDRFDLPNNKGVYFHRPNLLAISRGHCVSFQPAMTKK